MKRKFLGATTLAVISGIAACAAELPIGSFADGTVDGWMFNQGKEFPGAQGSLTIVEDKEASSGRAASMEGNFEKGGNYVSMTKILPTPVPFETLKFKAKTSGIAALVIRLTDNSGQIHQRKVKVAESLDWQTVELNDYKGEYYSSFGGAKDGKLHDPIRAVSILISKDGLLPGSKSGKVFLANIALTLRAGLLSQPQNYGVYQRNADNTAQVPVVIHYAPEIKSLAYRYRPGDDWQPLKLQRNADNIASAITLPSGGWYRVELKQENQDGKITEKVVEHVGVGEVFITAGQSNAANWGEPRQKTTTGMVTVFDGKAWRPAIDPLPICDGNQGSIWPLVGDRLTTELKVPIGFLCLGVGGSEVGQWTPENFRNKVKGKVNYGRFVQFMPLLKPYGCRALLWHQGESDRMAREKEVYYNNLKSIITSFQHDFGNTPWLVAIVGNSWMDANNGIGCRAAQQQIIADKIALPGPDTDAIGKEFRLKEGKSSHFNQKGLEQHAALWCEVIRKDLF